MKLYERVAFLSVIIAMLYITFNSEVTVGVAPFAKLIIFCFYILIILIILFYKGDY